MKNTKYTAAVLALLLAGCSSAAPAASSSAQASSSSEEAAVTEEAPQAETTEEVAGVTTSDVNGTLEQGDIELPQQEFSRALQPVKVNVNVFDQNLTMPFDAKELTSLNGIKATQDETDKLISNTYLSDGYCTLSVTIDKNNKITRISDNQSNYWGLMTEDGLRRGVTEQTVLDTLKNVQYKKETFNDQLWMYYYEVENDDLDYPYAVYTYTCGEGGVYAVDVTLLGLGEDYFAAEDLAKLAANYYYYDGAKEWAPYYNMSINLDGTFDIQLYEDNGTNTATWAWYKVNRMGKGIDILTNQPVDFMKYLN